jgi:1,4-dihydroxy-2-naphthoyl-CoA hydrolase
MSVWFKKSFSIDEIKKLSKDTMAEHIGIELTEIGENYLKGRMPVDQRTRQPYGLLHGGASVTLAETLGSIASAMVIDPSSQICVGLEINANHVRGARQGYVYGTATPLHIGGSTHVWEIRIVDEKEKLICVSRLTVAILKKNDQMTGEGS